MSGKEGRQGTEGVDEPPSIDQPSLFATGQIDEEASASDEKAPGIDRVFAFDGEPSMVYVGSLITGAILLILAAALGLVSWLLTFIGIVGLAATMFRGGSRVALLAGVAVVGIAVADLWPDESVPPPAIAVSGPAQGSTEPESPPEGSLAITIDQVVELWNGLDSPPLIDRGLVRSAESGPLDAFVHRFDDQASLVGAYDPSTGYVYALAASARFDHPAATNMYLHLCYMLHPFSQECIDAYWEEGLQGKKLEDYRGLTLEGQWRLEGNTWKLGIAGNTQELQVVGDLPVPGESG